MALTAEHLPTEWRGDDGALMQIGAAWNATIAAASISG